MTNLEEKNRPENQEIDLLYFFQPLINGLKKAGSALSVYFHILVANTWLFIGIILFTGGMGFLVRYFLPKAYETEGIFLSHTLPASFCVTLVNGMDRYSGEKTRGRALEHQLKIRPDAAAAVKSLEASLVTDSLYINSYKRDTALSVFKITLVTHDTSSITEVQNGVVSFLENNEYSVKRKKARIQTWKSLDADLTAKISGLDSVKKIVNSSIIPRASGQGIILGEPINPVSIYQQEMIYYKEKLSIAETLATYSNIEVVQPFFPVEDYNYPHANALLKNFLLVGLALALIATPIVGRRRPV
ncbi:MAG TPA: hypothetical protein VGM41_13300 [Chitinophagaceae bacterium]|jgi:hypothetical protein